MVKKYRKHDNHLFDMIDSDNHIAQTIEESVGLTLPDTFCELAWKNCSKTNCANCKAYIDLERELDNPRAPY